MLRISENFSHVDCTNWLKTGQNWPKQDTTWNHFDYLNSIQLRPDIKFHEVKTHYMDTTSESESCGPAQMTKINPKMRTTTRQSKNKIK